jgi:E3 ubiquitin-protein ligase TRIP12
MDLQPNHQQEATSIPSAPSIPSFPQVQQHNQSFSSASSSSTESRALRSSARVKAAKQREIEKCKGKERELESDQLSAIPSESISHTIRAITISSKSKRSRDQVSGKGKGKEVTDDQPSRPSKRYRIIMSGHSTYHNSRIFSFLHI